MLIKTSLIKPVVDAILELAKSSDKGRLKKNAEKAIREAIRELLLANPNKNEVEAKIDIAKAAGLISGEVILAEDMLNKVKIHRIIEERTNRRIAKKPKKQRRSTTKQNRRNN